MRVLAQSVSINGQKITGPLDSGINSLGDIINRLLLVLVPLGAIILFLVLIWGGYDFLLSGGNPERVKKGRAKITSALIGFILLVSAYLITKIVSQIFGLGTGIFQ